jgi:hypothetical protein
MYGLCMATKTISIETDACELLARGKQDPRESFSGMIRQFFVERPALPTYASPHEINDGQQDDRSQ